MNEHHMEFLSLKGGCTGLSESTHVKMPHCWKSHVTAQLIRLLNLNCVCTVCINLFSGNMDRIDISKHLENFRDIYFI